MKDERGPWSLLHEAVFPSPIWSAIEATVYADGDRYRVTGPGSFLAVTPLAIVQPAAND